MQPRRVVVFHRHPQHGENVCHKRGGANPESVILWVAKRTLAHAHKILVGLGRPNNTDYLYDKQGASAPLPGFEPAPTSPT